jgi:hypothetical protein
MDIFSLETFNIGERKGVQIALQFFNEISRQSENPEPFIEVCRKYAH